MEAFSRKNSLEFDSRGEGREGRGGCQLELVCRGSLLDQRGGRHSAGMIVGPPDNDPNALCSR